MATPLSLADRVHIELTIWRFDALVWDLPKRGRRAIRKELRANLIAAAAQHGAKQAIRQLGNLPALAEEYLDAEYGPAGPRPRWRSGTYWAVTVELAVILTSLVGFVSFMDGVQAAGAHATGTYRWGGWLGMFGPTGSVELRNGEFRGFEFEMSLWFLVLPLIAFLIGSRGWRSIAPWWRHRRTRCASAS
jgi:hypothetical protein